jgi:membrane protease subunit HflK
MTASSKIMIDVEGGNNMLYVPLDKIMEQNSASVRLGGSTQDLRDLANQLAPFLPGPSTVNTVDRTRLGSDRGGRP